MNRRDQELLEKQLRWLNPSPRRDGALAFAMLMIFVAGISVGGAFFAHENNNKHFTLDYAPLTFQARLSR